MGKRGNGEGSVYRTKNGLWRGSYWVTTAKGLKRRYVSAKTRQQCSQKLTKAMADRDGGLIFEAGDLTSAHLRSFYRDRLDSGRAPATVHKLHVVLHKALKAAVADGLIPRNAAG